MAAEFIEAEEYEAPDTLEECGEDLEEVCVEIDSIREQLELYDTGDLPHLGPDWRKKAVAALIYRKVDKKKLKRKIRSLTPIQDGPSRETLVQIRKVEHFERLFSQSDAKRARLLLAVGKQREQLQAQKKKFAAAKAAMHIQNNLQSTRASAAAKFVRGFAPELIHELYDAMSEAEHEFRKRHDI